LKFILSVPPEELARAVEVALAHLRNCPKEPLSNMDFYVAGSVCLAYTSRLDKDTLTVWRSEIMEG